MWSALTAGGDPRQFVCLQYPNAYLKKETLHGETKIWKAGAGRASHVVLESHAPYDVLSPPKKQL